MIFSKSKKVTLFSTAEVQLKNLMRPTQCGLTIGNTSERFLKFASIETVLQYLNLRPKTNPIKAIKRKPSNVDQINLGIASAMVSRPSMALKIYY